VLRRRDGLSLERRTRRLAPDADGSCWPRRSARRANKLSLVAN
jgi:hypothetical protein